MNLIEEEIRMLLRSKAPQAPVRDEPPPVVLRRTRTMRVVNAVAGASAVAAMAVGALLAVQSIREPNAGLLTPAPVPWIDAPVDQAAMDPAAYQGGLCHASEVDFAVVTTSLDGELRFERKPGSRVVGRLDAACLLDPKEGLRIRLLDGGGRALPIEVEFGSAPAIWVEPGRTTFLAFTWSNYCGPDVSTISFEVSLPHDGARMFGSPTTGSRGAPRCGEPGTATRITLRSAGTRPSGGEPRSTFSELEIAIDAPLNVARGQRLLYTVTLLNRSDTAIRLDPCPAYEQSMGAEVGGTYRLNCRGAGGEVDPGSAVRFAMELLVPADLSNYEELSRMSLTWQLEGSGAPKISATVWVI